MGLFWNWPSPRRAQLKIADARIFPSTQLLKLASSQRSSLFIHDSNICRCIVWPQQKNWHEWKGFQSIQFAIVQYRYPGNDYWLDLTVTVSYAVAWCLLSIQAIVAMSTRLVCKWMNGLFTIFVLYTILYSVTFILATNSQNSSHRWRLILL